MCQQNPAVTVGWTSSLLEAGVQIWSHHVSTPVMNRTFASRSTIARVKRPTVIIIICYISISMVTPKLLLIVILDIGSNLNRYPSIDFGSLWRLMLGTFGASCNGHARHRGVLPSRQVHRGSPRPLMAQRHDQNLWNLQIQQKLSVRFPNLSTIGFVDL